MHLIVRELNGQRFGEGPPGAPLVRDFEDVATLIEVCLTDRLHRLLLYPENLTQDFFDLSSREAGMILQKLRNYHIRLAVLHSPTLQLSSRFGEMIEDESRKPYFRLFDKRSSALEWLCAD
jgi:hypothetical protein